MNIYADASVLIPLFTRDAFSARADAFIEAARPVMVLSDFAAAEFASAIARKTRTRDLTEAEARATFSLFDSWAAAQAARVQVAPADMSAAEAFVRRLDLNLRTPDAVNIAIALRLGADLATFDARMADSARALGCGVVAL